MPDDRSAEPREWTELSICPTCWCVVGIDGKANEDRPYTICSHLQARTVRVLSPPPGREDEDSLAEARGFTDEQEDSDDR